MKKKGKENLYNDEREQEEILREEYFLDKDIEDDEYWLDDEDEPVEEEEYSDEDESVEEEEDYWLDDDSDFEEEDSDDKEYEEIEEYSEEDGEYYEEEYIPEAEEKAMKKKRKKKKKNKKILKRLVITGGVIAAIYLGISAFFISHFYYNTSINGADCSLKSVASVEEYIKKQVEGYTLTIKEKNNIEETIVGTDISLVYEESDEIQKALNSQNPLLWPKAFFDKSLTDVTVQVSYEEEEVNKLVDALQALQVEQTEPVNAYPKFDGEQFVIEPEVTGTAVNAEVLKEKVKQYITEFRSELDMIENNCYKLPQYTTESKELQKACEEMNKYLVASITYKMTEDVVVDKSVINGWITVDDKLQVIFDETKVKEWLTWFGDTYDTVGTTRSITSPWGKTVEVAGGDYGWSIDEETEYTALVESVKAGEVVEKEPAYYQTAAVHGAQDWGTTYVEVDIGSQHMWMIQNGDVAMECDVVTGTPVPSRVTPTGVFAMKEKMYGKTLIGEIDPDTGEPEYRTPVSYWMRVTWTGIGFHDATWQSSFGGNRYQNGAGSHGCINMPYSSAATLIELVYTGIPVIIHN